MNPQNYSDPIGQKNNELIMTMLFGQTTLLKEFEILDLFPIW